MNTATAASAALLDYLKEQQKAQSTSPVVPPTPACSKVSKAARRSRKAGLAFASPTASSSQSTREDDEVDEDNEEENSNLYVETLCTQTVLLTKTNCIWYLFSLFEQGTVIKRVIRFLKFQEGRELADAFSEFFMSQVARQIYTQSTLTQFCTHHRAFFLVFA